MSSTETLPQIERSESPRRAAGWLDGRSWDRRDVLAAVGLGFLTVIVVWLLRTSIVPTDPWNYVQAARNFPADTWVPLGYTRYGMILPLIPVVALFGDAEISYYFWPLVGAGVTAASLYLLGARFWSRITGVVAIVLAFASPLVFANLSRNYPDAQSTGWFLLAVVLCFYARDRRSLTGTAPALPLLAAGFLLGWAFEARETSCLTWPLIAVILWDRGRELRRAFLLVAGAMAVWAVADLAIGLFGYGDALMRVHAFTRQDLAATQLPADQAVLAELVGRDRLFYFLAVPRYLWAAPSGIWYLVVGGVAGIGLAFARSRFAALLFLVAYLGFAGIAGGFVPDHPSGRIDIQRYWVPFLIYAGLAAAGTVHAVSGVVAGRLPGLRGRGLRLTRRGVEVALALLLALGPVIGLAGTIASNSSYAINGAVQLPALSRHLASSTDGPTRVWTDWQTMRLLPVYQLSRFGTQRYWSGKISSLNTKSKLRPGDYIVVHSLNDNSCSACRSIISAYVEQVGGIPPDWVEEWASPQRNVVLYRVP